MPTRGASRKVPLSSKAKTIVFNCVNIFREQHELETYCRRCLIAYVDIGMDVHQAGEEPPIMAGQVILSLPGGRPQVVWPNGALASTAVGIAVNLLTDWSRSQRRFVYLQYDGASGTVMPHVRVQYLQNTVCNHYPVDQVGEPRASKL